MKEKPKPESKAVKRSIDYQRAAKLHFRQGKTLMESLTSVGVSPKQAARGRNYMARHSKRFADAFGKEASRKLREAQVLGQSLSNDEIRMIVRGRLAQISAQGEGTAKGATQATTQLGKLTGVERSSRRVVASTCSNFYPSAQRSGATGIR